MKKAVAYMRYSSENQNEASIEHQRNAIICHCIANELELVREYVDKAKTGTNDRRPAFQALMQDAQCRPDWDMVLVFDFSRFCRNSGDAKQYTDRLEDRDIRLVSVTENIDDSPQGQFMRQVIHLMNEFYSKCNARATHAGMSVKAEKAGHCGGIPPLGYDLDRYGNLVINEDEAKAVRKIYDMVEQNFSYARIARALNDDGHRTKVGRPFTKYSFDNILHQEKYIGTFIWNKTRQKNSKSQRNSHAKKSIDKQVRIDGGCPQIISEEQFWRVQEMLASRSQGQAASKSRQHYMLGGLKIIKCAKCGSYMVGTTRSSHGKKYITYACPKHKSEGCPTKEISAESLERMVAGLLVKDLYNRDDHSALSRQMTHNSDYKALQDKKRGIQKAIAGVMKAIETECSETLVARLQQLEDDQAAVEHAIAKSKISVTGITKENRKRVCSKFGNYLRTADDPDAKAYIISAVKEILVSNDDISIQLNVA